MKFENKLEKLIEKFQLFRENATTEHLLSWRHSLLKEAKEMPAFLIETFFEKRKKKFKSITNETSRTSTKFQQG